MQRKLVSPLKVQKVAGVFGLWGLKNPWLELGLTAATVLALALSRFLLLANGPWEWDEANFARGILSFNLEAHFPHPPGFPLWIFLGWLLTPLAGEPLVALQWLSAAASVLLVWPLARLGRAVAPAAVATAAVILVQLTPGVWLHAERAFSSTAATALALAGGAVLVGGLAGRRVTVFTVLLCLSALTRPQLLPALGLMWCLAVFRRCPWRRVLPGVLISCSLVVGSFVGMAWATGGWSSLTAAFTSHGARHVSRLAGNPGGLVDLGVVKGWGGIIPAALMASVGMAGLFVWGRRRSPKEAVAWALVLTVLAASVIGLHNRTYSRYAVPLQLAPAPLLAAAASLLPPAAGVAILLGSAVALAGVSWPLLVEQHVSRLPAWDGLLFAHDLARRKNSTVVLEPSIYPLASYLWYRERLVNGLEPPPFVLSPWAPEEWQGVSGPYVVVTDHGDRYLGPLFRGRLGWSGVSAELLPFTQARMLSAEVISNPPLTLGQWWPVERTPGGEPFMWAGLDSGLELPPLPRGTVLTLDLRPVKADAPFEVVVNDTTAATIEDLGNRQRIELVSLDSVRSNRIWLRGGSATPRKGEDLRPLSVQLWSVSVTGPWMPWSGSLTSPASRAAIAAVVDGAHGPEQFEGGPGVWSKPQVSISLPAGEDGHIDLELRAPRSTGPETVIRIGDRIVAGPLIEGEWPRTVTVDLAEGDVIDGRVTFDLTSVDLCPEEAGLGPDSRHLGVVLGQVSFHPDGEPNRLWW